MLALMWLWWDVKPCHECGMVYSRAAWQCSLQCFIQGRFSVLIYVCQIFRALALFQGGMCLNAQWPVSVSLQWPS